MRQSSEQFMDKMLEDNKPPVQTKTLSEQIAEEIDKKMEQAMSSFTEALSKVSTPDNQVNNNNNEKENLNNGNKESREEGYNNNGEEGNNEEVRD